MNQETIAFRLKHELLASTPDVWERIRRHIAREIAESLLRELEGLPSPQSRLFYELRDEAIHQSMNKGA